MRARSIAAVFVAVLLVGSLAGCSKKDSGSGDEATADTEQSTTTTVDKSDDNSSDSNSSDDNAGDDDSSGDGATADLGDCVSASVAFSTMIATSGAFMTGATEDQLKELQEQTDKLGGEVPDDLKDDLQTVSDAYKQLGEAVRDGGFAGKKAQDAVENLDSDEVTTASQNIEDYFESCTN